MEGGLSQKYIPYSDVTTIPDHGIMAPKTQKTTIYQQASGEKHVLFYPASTSSSLTPEDPGWSQQKSNINNYGKSIKLTEETPRTESYQNNETTTKNINESASQQNFQVDSRAIRISFNGLRKRCLYFVIFFLLVMIVINLTLTLWILKVMEISTEGMGPLKILGGGLQLNGQAMILDSLIASTIKSRQGHPLKIESSRNLTFSIWDDKGILTNRLLINNERLDFLIKSFQVLDERGDSIFSADENEVNIGAEYLRMEGAAGVSFNGSIQTPLVRAESAHELRLESPTRSLEIRAPVSVAIESRAGGIETSCLKDLKLESTAGSLIFDSSNIYLPDLTTVRVSPKSSGSFYQDSNKTGGAKLHHETYQVCSCKDGKLFLAPAHGACVVDDARICR